MHVLLDTHVLLWALMEPRKLSARVRRLLQNEATGIVVSAASAWEIATKFRLGRLAGAARVVADYPGALRGLHAVSLPINGTHAIEAGRWGVGDGDPFDRMLAAQARLEKLPLITHDAALVAFDIEIIW